jgi:glycosyltransferase involved in cell wall biosynthesis
MLTVAGDHSAGWPPSKQQKKQAEHSKTGGKRVSIGVIVPCYNGGRFLRDLVESLQSQTFSDWECIIVDDGSTDDSKHIANVLHNLWLSFRLLRTLIPPPAAQIRSAPPPLCHGLDQRTFDDNVRFRPRSCAAMRRPPCHVLCGDGVEQRGYGERAVARRDQDDSVDGVPRQRFPRLSRVVSIDHVKRGQSRNAQYLESRPGKAEILTNNLYLIACKICIALR